MRAEEKVWIGADPGGRKKFGLAILRANGFVATWCVDHADQAIEVVAGQVATAPAGVGVDAPLWWSSGRSSDRRADSWLRETYRRTGGQVQTGNSLRGAALIQGAMFVLRMRERFPGVAVTETHPKALMVALKVGHWDEIAQQFGLTARLQADAEHERDAALSALAAREGFEGRWSEDLSECRDDSEQDPSSYWLAPVHYFWPEM